MWSNECRNCFDMEGFLKLLPPFLCAGQKRRVSHPSMLKPCTYCSLSEPAERTRIEKWATVNKTSATVWKYHTYLAMCKNIYPWPSNTHTHTCTHAHTHTRARTHTHAHTCTHTHTHRPEADDLKAMQQELSSLHLVIEQSAIEHEKRVELVSSQKQKVEEENKRWARL